jgi:predicted nucleotidyltransferase
MRAAWEEQDGGQESGRTESAQPAPIQFYGGYQVYSESGIDLTLLRENLKRTVTERLEKNQRGLELVKEVDKSRLAKARSHLSSESALMLQDRKIIQQLTDSGVDFVLIGGLAMRAHGSAHITEDVDVCYSRTKENIQRLADAMDSLHPYMRGAPAGLPFRFDAPTIQAGLNFTLLTDLGEIDFLGEVSGLGNYEKVVAQSEELLLYDRKIRVLSLDGLLIAKKTAGRRKDQGHILELEELKKMRDEGTKS